MSYLKLVLRATKLEDNLDRSYEIHMCKGLFESWLVITAYGRYGAGQGALQKIQSFYTLDDAEKCVYKIMQKRRNAFQRIGCNYEVIERVTSERAGGN
jgi:hypothetical protein